MISQYIWYANQQQLQKKRERERDISKISKSSNTSVHPIEASRTEWEIINAQTLRD